ncbi:hypothetical protein ACZ91_22535 [Streptomyces regensis]|nr:hypothetical protein ACZ91_22535 [Streptomyces regensis]
MKTGMTIAVLGATGMVGSRVVTEARARGHRVLALSRTPASDDPDLTPIAVDATDYHALHDALAGSAAHRAADAVVLTIRTEPADREFLVGATRTVLDLTAQLGIRVLLVGGTDNLLTDADGRSWISAEDLAVAVLDELGAPGPERLVTVVHRDAGSQTSS